MRLLVLGAGLQGTACAFDLLNDSRVTQVLLADYARRNGLGRVEAIPADARLVQFVETQLAGAIGSASSRALVASVVQEEPLALDEVARILDESRALRQANEALQSLDRLKDDFMSSVTHELRTPLTSIRALAEMMADDPHMDTAQRQRFLGIIVSEAERLSRLVNQVLDLAKIEAGHAEWHNSDLDLRVLCEQAAQAMAAPLQAQGTLLKLELPPGLPPLRADADRLLQVLLNLLGNAAKYVPRPGGEITLRLLATPEAALLQVQDNGPGVPAELQAQVFDKFRQGPGQAVGTGLGLAISRQIVEHFGGRIRVKPDVAQGACFEFSLPWQPRQGDMP